MERHCKFFTTGLTTQLYNYFISEFIIFNQLSSVDTVKHLDLNLFK